MESQNQANNRIVRPGLWLLIVLGLIGNIFFFAKFDESFPAASIDLRLSRAQIVERARQWAKKIGYDDSGSINSTIFTYDDDAKTFLEHELGQSKANELMRSRIPIWSWTTRFCKPFQIEECSINLTPAGQIFTLQHTLPSELPMPSISHAQALSLARDFVEKSVGLSLAGSKLIKDSQEKQAHRTDHYFSWEDEKNDFQDGRMRYDVYISGDKVTDFNQGLHVPEKFDRKFNEMRSYNYLLKTISSIIYIILSSAISFIFVWAFVSGRIRWRLAAIAGAIAAVLAVFNWLDSWPTIVAGYITTMSFQQYVVQKLISMVLGALYAAVSAIVFIGALEPVYRLAFPDKVSLEKIVSQAGLRSAAVVQSLLAGLAMFGMHTAYVVAFYLLGNRIGFWSPLEVRETSTLSSLYPVFNAMNVGINASTMEELMYRVLALVMFKRLTGGNFWLADLLQAAAWAFMHSDYPQEPSYARGVELTIGGFFYGYILRRYGLLACLLAHYTYDAFLGVTPLLSSPLLVDKAMALMAVAPGPLALVASALLIKRKGLNTDTQPLLNEAVPPAKAPSMLPHLRLPVPFVYTPVSKRMLCSIVCGALVLLSLVAFLPAKTAGSNDQMRVPREQAIQSATDYLMQQGLPVKGYKTLAYIADEDDEMQLQYVLEKEKYARTVQLAAALSPRFSWKVRFFKELDPQQFYVSVGPDGKVLAQWIVEDEDAAGAKLEQAAARKIAEDFLHKVHPEYEPYVFDDATKHELKNRNDYSFTYRVERLKAGDADFKISTGVVGKYVSSFNRSWDLPDKWIFERDKVAFKDNVFMYMRWCYYFLAVLAALWWLTFTLRKGHIYWRWPLIIGVGAALIAIVKQLNWLPVVFLNYSTDVHINTYLAEYASRSLISVLSGTAVVALLAAFAQAAFPQVCQDISYKTILQALAGGDRSGLAGKRRLWLDGVIVGYGIALVLAGVEYVFDVMSYFTSPAVHLPSLSGVSTASQQWSPALGAAIDGLSTAVMAVLGIVVSVAFLYKIFGSSLRNLFLFILVTAAVSYSYLRYWQDYLWNLAAFICLAVLAYFFIMKMARRNALAYLLAGYAAVLTTVIHALAKNAFSLYYADIAVMALALAAPAIYTAWLYRKPKRRATGVMATLSSLPPIPSLESELKPQPAAELPDKHE